MYECTKNRSVTSAEPCPTPIALTAFRKCRRNVKARSTNLYFKEAKKENMEEGVILSEYWKYISSNTVIVNRHRKGTGLMQKKNIWKQQKRKLKIIK